MIAKSRTLPVKPREILERRIRHQFGVSRSVARTLFELTYRNGH